MAPRVVTPAPIQTIAQLAAALNIQDNQMGTAVTTEAITMQVGRINPTTGHMFTIDNAARARAAGPDQPDPPRHPFVGRSFAFRPPMGFPPPGHPAPRMPGGPPGGGFPGGGGGGGFPGGPGGNPPQGAPQGGGHQPSDRLVSNPLFIYNGDPACTKEFLAAWKLYQRVNHSTNQMDNMY